MKRWLLAATFLVGAASAAYADCGNVVHNLFRSRECEAYAGSDWGKHRNLRDVRVNTLQEWMDKYSGSGKSFEHMLKEADIMRSHALTRDVQIFGKDEEMWKSRGCGELPLCKEPKVTKADPETNPTPLPEKQVRELEKPQPRQGRNRRTGGNYCGPRDTARGYCD